MQPARNPLVGRWVVDPSDQISIREYGNVEIQFSPDGMMTYTIHAADKDQIILLTYRLEGGTLITDQPSHPAEERTPCSVGADGKLRLVSDGITTIYIRKS